MSLEPNTIDPIETKEKKEDSHSYDQLIEQAKLEKEETKKKKKKEKKKKNLLQLSLTR